MKIELEQLRRVISKTELATFLKDFPELDKWLMRKGEKTKEKYLRNLIRYIETLHKNEIITEKTPNGLLELARKQTEESKPHVEILEEFQTSCEDIFPEDKRAIIFSISITIKSFYNFKGYTFPRFRGNFEYSPKEKERLPKTEELIEYIDTIKNIRSKTIIALESSACIRMESLLNLKWRHFREVLEKVEIPMIRLEASELKGKARGRYSKIKQICFLTPFAKDYITRYKNWYEAQTQKKISLEEPESLELPFLISDDNAEPLTYAGLNSALERGKSERFPFRLHIWRTYVNERLMKAGISKEHRDVFLGHKQSNVEKAYSMVTELRGEFRNAIKLLDPAFKEDENIKKIKEKVKELKGVEVSDSEARQILDTVLMKFFRKE